MFAVSCPRAYPCCELGFQLLEPLTVIALTRAHTNTPRRITDSFLKVFQGHGVAGSACTRCVGKGTRSEPASSSPAARDKLPGDHQRGGWPHPVQGSSACLYEAGVRVPQGCGRVLQHLLDLIEHGKG